MYMDKQKILEEIKINKIIKMLRKSFFNDFDMGDNR